MSTTLFFEQSPQLNPSLPVVGGLRPLPTSWGEYPPKSSAVCMLFIPPESPEQEAHVLFIRRAAHLRSHSGQVGFPGGRREEGDLSPVDTALRETSEELGIPEHQIKAFGALDPVIALDGHDVVPIIATSVIHMRDIKPAPDEVAAVFAVPWRFVAEKNDEEFYFTMFGVRRRSIHYRSPEVDIWGLTAKMLQHAALRVRA